jgi:hypothetical protein
MWRRDEDLRIESALDAERFIEDVGFANTLTDARRAGPFRRIKVTLTVLYWPYVYAARWGGEGLWPQTWKTN